MKKQGFNPYLPSWEYVPDGEPYVFDGRVYVYGSHDRFNGWVYCLNDYVCWSAPEDDLSDWRFEGVIYRKTDDPLNRDGRMCLYAPDVTRGPDGRYYLYYVLDEAEVVSVAVCDRPAGKYEFYGYVHDRDGRRLGERAGDQMQFDPGVLTEDGLTYMYTAFCPPDDAGRSGAMMTVLEPDMLTMRTEPVFVAPSRPHSAGTSFEGHEFFEASSIRKVGDKYYFIYSSVAMHELCYAVSRYPDRDFVYQGVIISSNDSHIGSYKPPEKPMYYAANNHGSIVEIRGQWYIFYHRHTNGTNFSRQACLEPLVIQEDGRILQAEITSCGPNGGPLRGEGEYPAYIACHLFCREECGYTAPPGEWMDCRFPKITQDGADGEECPSYICNMRDGACAGFRYFDFSGVRRISVRTRGYANGEFYVKTAWDGEPAGKIPVRKSNIWREHTAEVNLPDGVHALYFEYHGEGAVSLLSFQLDAG